MIDQSDHGFRLLNLGGDPVPMALKAGLKQGQFRIAMTVVEGSGMRKGHIGALARSEPERKSFVSAGKYPRLQERRLKLDVNAGSEEQHGGNEG